MALPNIKKATVKDWCLTRQASFARTVTLKSISNGVTSVIDLTGYGVEAPILDKNGEQIDTFAAAVAVPESDGQITLALTVTQINALPVTSRWYLRVFLIADPENNSFVLAVGDVIVNDPGKEDDCC